MRFLIVFLLLVLIVSCTTVKSQTVLPVGDNRYVVYLRFVSISETEGDEIMRKIAVDTCPNFRKTGESSSREGGDRVKFWVIECPKK
jgi:hypothetical protein